MATSFLCFNLFFAIIGLTLGATQCGETDFARKLISRGSTTERGEFPFVASLYSVQDKHFICGGSLISAKHVLTAAHCVNPLFPDDVIVYLGAYDLTSRTEIGVVQRYVSTIRVHPDLDAYSGNLDADLAILDFSERVPFTNYIRPVCIPPDNFVINRAGTIVGWGLTENGTQPHLDYLKQGVTIALNSYCYTTDTMIASISSLRTFCGNGDVSSPNAGDSGGGFFVRYGSAWVQYGIISAIHSNATGYVDPNSIAVYTSVKDFKTWINDTVRQSGGEICETNQMSKIKIQMKCEYGFNSETNAYGCFVDDLDIRSENIEILKY